MKPPANSDSVRVDTGVITGDEVSIFYDPMIAKLIVHGKDRQCALDSLVKSLKQFQIVGLDTNIEFLARTASHPEFQKGGVNTSFLEHHGVDLMTPLGDIPLHGMAIGATCVWMDQMRQRSTTSASSLYDHPSLWAFRILSDYTKVLEFASEHNSSPIRIHVRCPGRVQDGFFVSVEEKDGNDKKSPEILVQGQMESNGEFQLTLNNTHKYQGTAVMTNDAVHVFCDDDSLQYKYSMGYPEPTFLSSSQDTGQNHVIRAPMPGKVIKMLVTPGQRVQKDEPLLIMEAMKMEHIIRAPQSGTVDQVHYIEGDFIEGKSSIVIAMAQESKMD